MDKIQQVYFDKIQSDKLKSLIEWSYTFHTMNDQEKLDLLMRASVCHKDLLAEEELIEMFEEEQQDIKDAVDNIEPISPREEEKQIKVMAKEMVLYKKTVGELKEAIQKIN
jgi:hypothetical protein